MYLLESDKTKVGVNVRRYLLNCHASNALVLSDEIEKFTERRSDGKRNYQAFSILREYIKYGIIQEIDRYRTFKVLHTKQIQDDLALSETHYDLRPPAGYMTPPPMPLSIFGDKQLTGRSKKLEVMLIKHMIFCHQNGYSIRAQELKQYSAYQYIGCGTPSNVSKFMSTLKDDDVIRAKSEKGYYEIVNLDLLESKLRQREEKINLAAVPKVGRPFKPDEYCTPKELLKRQQERDRYWNKRRNHSKERQHPVTPDWLVMTESLIMNMNGTAKHTPEIDGRWREFCT